MLVKELEKNERPREKALKYGIKVLSDRELLALLIRNGYNNYSALDIADDLLRQHHSLTRLLSLNWNDLVEHKGIKVAKALEIMATWELAKRMLMEEAEDKDVISSPNVLINWLQLKFGFMSQEQFIVVFLNTKNHIIGYEVIAKGGLDFATVHPREVFKQAIKMASAKIICVHNHPSGDITPSPADIEVTERLAKAGSMLYIPVLDHLIIGSGKHYSFRDNQLLNP